MVKVQVGLKDVLVLFKDRQYIDGDMQQLSIMSGVRLPCMRERLLWGAFGLRCCSDASILSARRWMCFSTHVVPGFSSPQCTIFRAVCAGCASHGLGNGVTETGVHFKCSWCWPAGILDVQNLMRLYD